MSNPTPLVRGELLEDYALIADLHARAFGNGAEEPLIVALHRQRAAFDPDLSLVATEDGQVLGHALFSPRPIRLLGEDVAVVILSPIAVDPARQREGIGSRLMETGHEIAASKGYALTFLVGHPWYYPRFGYRTRAYGRGETAVSVADLPASRLEQRTPSPEDIPALQALWRQDEGEVDFAIDPGSALLDWFSPNPAIASTVYLRDGEITGYTRIHGDRPHHPLYFLASGAEAALQVAASVAGSIEGEVGELILPVHPSSRSASAFPPARISSFDAAMAMSLALSPLERYFELVATGDRPPGRVIWPVEFDVD